MSDEGDGRARFELEHVAPVDAHWDEFGPGAVGIGWDLTVMGLALHLASGGAARRRRGGHGLDDLCGGPRFMTVSNAAWRDADIADGTDPEIATAAAARTLAAYTEPDPNRFGTETRGGPRTAGSRTGQMFLAPSSNLAKRGRKVRCTVPIGPFRCLATISSVSPSSAFSRS